MESDSANAIRWASNLEGRPRKFHVVLDEIKAPSSSAAVSSSHVAQKANFMANSLAKQGVERTVPIFDSIL